MSRLVDRKVLLTHVTHERVLNAFAPPFIEKIHIVIRIIPANINSLLFSFPFFSYPRRWIEEEEEEEKKKFSNGICKMKTANTSNLRENNFSFHRVKRGKGKHEGEGNLL